MPTKTRDMDRQFNRLIRGSGVNSLRPASQAVSDPAVGTWLDEKLTPKFMLHLRYGPTPLRLRGFRVCENFRDSFWFLAELAKSVIDSVFRAIILPWKDKGS